MKEPGSNDGTYRSNQEKIGGGKKQKNVGYCDEGKVAKNNLELHGTCFNLVLKWPI